MPAAVKEERSKILGKIAEKTKAAFRMNYIGRTMEVLFEHMQDGLWEGHTHNYIPVRAASVADLSGKMVMVRLVENKPDYVQGVIEG